MNAGERSVLRDPELVEMLLDDPELLAIADALTTTSGKSLKLMKLSNHSARRRFATAAGIAAAAAATVALLMAAPWQGGPGFVQKALAAVGDGPVLHVVVTRPAVYGGPLIDLRTGKTISQTQRTEIWFDRERNLKKTIEKLDRSVLDEELETDQGGWDQGGLIITCEWIAAHPVEAASLRVSCNGIGGNATTSQNVTERPPLLDPALAGFVDHYRSALESGLAETIGTGKYGGRDVLWLEFAANGQTERVAVDARSYKPLAIEEKGGQLTFRVLEAAAVPYSPSFFSRPKAVKAQRGSTVTAERQVTPQVAAAALGGRALWLGRSWNGLKLVATKHQMRTIGYGPGREPGQADVVKFTYAPMAADGKLAARSRVDIYESTSCVLTIGWECNARDPATPGEFKRLGPISLLRGEGLYVSTWNVPSAQEALRLVRALRSLTVQSR